MDLLWLLGIGALVAGFLMVFAVLAGGLGGGLVLIVIGVLLLVMNTGRYYRGRSRV